MENLQLIPLTVISKISCLNGLTESGLNTEFFSEDGLDYRSEFESRTEFNYKDIFFILFRYKESSGWQLFTGENLLKAHPVRNIIPYPQVKYNQFLYNNDIALVELEKPLTFSRNVSAVCLPKHPIQVRITNIWYQEYI